MLVADGFHLTYCSNIHPGETWQEVSDALARWLPEVRRQLRHEGPFAVGLRLSAAAAEQLERPLELAAFLRFLHEGDYYVPTMNGFLRRLHGVRQRAVYQLARPESSRVPTGSHVSWHACSLTGPISR
jgi:hypothetical protein